MLCTAIPKCSMREIFIFVIVYYVVILFYYPTKLRIKGQNTKEKSVFL